MSERRRSPQRPSVGNIGRLIIRRDVLLPSLLSAVIQYANWATALGFLLILARQLGATDVIQSLLMSMSMTMGIVGNLLATIIVRRIGARRMAWNSFVVLSVGIGIAVMAPSLRLVFVSQFCIGLSAAIGCPVLMGMSIQHVADAERTTAMGLHQAVYAIGMFSGPWVSGMLADAVGIRSMFGITAVMCLALGLLGTRWLSDEP